MIGMTGLWLALIALLAGILWLAGLGVRKLYRAVKNRRSITHFRREIEDRHGLKS